MKAKNFQGEQRKEETRGDRGVEVRRSDVKHCKRKQAGCNGNQGRKWKHSYHSGKHKPQEGQLDTSR